RLLHPAPSLLSGAPPVVKQSGPRRACASRSVPALAQPAHAACQRRPRYGALAPSATCAHRDFAHSGPRAHAVEHALLRGGRARPEGERFIYPSPGAPPARAGGLAPSVPPPAIAGCGCDKPAPPRATIRPFVAAPSQSITLFNSSLEDGATYDV